MNRNSRTRPKAPKRTTWPPERTASDCFDWLTAEDMVRLALGAYYLETGRLKQLPDDPTGEAGEFTNGRQGFADALVYLLTLRVDQHGFKVGAPGFEDYATDRLRKYSEGITVYLADIHDEQAQISSAGIYPDIHRALSMQARGRAK